MVDTSGVLISDGVAVGNIVEVAGGDGGVDEPQQIDSQSHHQTHQQQPMEVDALTEHAQVIGKFMKNFSYIIILKFFLFPPSPMLSP